MKEVFICDAFRSPIGKYGGSLANTRPDDLLAFLLKTLKDKYPSIDWNELDDVIIGCSNQAGEDNRNIARMSLLLAGFDVKITGYTVNRLCGSGMQAVGNAAQAIISGYADLIIAGGVESMSRAPFVMPKAANPFDRNITIYDTTIGWRFPNPLMQQMYGTEAMIETAENLAEMFNINREDQDKFAFWSQKKALDAQAKGFFKNEIIPIPIQKSKNETFLFDKDEHPRETTLEKLANLKPLVKPEGTVTAGNSSGINDGAAVLLIASEQAVKKYNLTPLAKILMMTTAGVPPRIMGIGPVPATEKLLNKLNKTLNDFDIIEINEAFAAQALACIRQLKLADNDNRINPLGGAIALGHPLGMSGARLITTAVNQLQLFNKKLALCTMCIGVGQGISMAIEKI